MLLVCTQGHRLLPRGFKCSQNLLCMCYGRALSVNMTNACGRDYCVHALDSKKAACSLIHRPPRYYEFLLWSSLWPGVLEWHWWWHSPKFKEWLKGDPGWRRESIFPVQIQHQKHGDHSEKILCFSGWIATAALAVAYILRECYPRAHPQILTPPSNRV